MQGVFGSSDSTAALAVVVADRLGLPGPGYEAFMRCHDKLVSRRIQAEAVPEATPRFAPLDAMRPPERPPLPYPFFVKPVQGHLSQHAYQVDSDERLAEVLAAAPACQLPPPDRRGAARRGTWSRSRASCTTAR